MEVVDLLRRDGVAVVYVSHRLDEVFRALRPGDRAARRSAASTPGRRRRDHPPRTRLQDARSGGRRRRSRADAFQRATKRPSSTEPVLCAPPISPGAMSWTTCRWRLAPARSWAWPACSDRAERETAKAIYGAQPLDERIGGGRRCADPTRFPSAALAAGVALIPEDRKADGIIPSLSVRDNIVLAALPALSRARFRVGSTAGCHRRTPDGAAADQGIRSRPAGRRAVRRQPAEGPARPRAVPRAARAHPRRSRRAGSTSAPRRRSRRSSASWRRSDWPSSSSRPSWRRSSRVRTRSSCCAMERSSGPDGHDVTPGWRDGPHRGGSARG